MYAYVIGRFWIIRKNEVDKWFGIVRVSEIIGEQYRKK